MTASRPLPTLADVFDFADPLGMPPDKFKVVDETLAILGSLACEILKADMLRYGNQITNLHAQALARIIDKYGVLAAKLSQGRIAYDLDTGCGKTLSVVAWIAAMLQLRFPFSVAVAASQVEALCDIKRKLIEKDIDPELIGLHHSKKYNVEKAERARRGDPELSKDWASLPKTKDNDQRQVILATHERVRSPDKTHEFNLYRGQDRDLVIWDESLLTTDSTSIPLHQLQSALGWLDPLVFEPGNRHSEREEQERTVDYLAEGVRLLEQEAAAQNDDKQPPKQLVLPERTQEEIADYKRLVRGVFQRESGNPGQAAALRNLLTISANSLRLATAGSSNVVVETAVAVPDELERVVVLDASYPIRELEQLDPTIQHDPKFDGRVKRYSQVTIHHWNHRSGNRSTSREFAERNPDDRTMAREVVEVVKQLPPDEAVLIFTFKTKQAKPPDFVSVLKDDLQRAGVDPDAKLADGRDRIVFLTWGRETSLSEFSYCGNVIFAGVLHRSYHDLAGEILGQRRDLLGELSGDEIEDVRRSEVAHRLYQAMSRGACRVVQGAEACRMNVWLPHWDEEVLDLLTKAMPGVQIVDWETVHVAADKASWEEVAETIVNYLGNLSQDVRKRSIQRLKKDCDLKGVSTKHFRKARDEALRRVDGWCLVGGSVAREDF